MRRLPHSRSRSSYGLAFLLLLCAAGIPAPFGASVSLTEDERNTIDVFRRAGRGVVHVDARAGEESRFTKHERAGSTGTGFMVDQEGRVLTAYHVIEGMNQVGLVLNNGRRITARLLGTAPQLDVALLQGDIPEAERVPLPLGDSGAVEVGQKMIAIGNSFGLHDKVTVGVVSAVQRTLGDRLLELDEAMIQTDAVINPGNSGGPLLNSAGQVIGINRVILQDAQNFAFAVVINLAQRVIPDLIEMGHPYSPQLGISGTAITPDLAKLFDLPLEKGVLVEEIALYSPAAEAGLRAGSRAVVVGEKPYILGGDTFTAINGRPVSSASQISRLLIESRPGEVLNLSIQRGGEKFEISIELQKMRMQF